MKYEKYQYIYPPRPKNAIPDSNLNFWDNGSLVAQPKVNGSNSVIFINGDKTMIMNRHGQYLTNVNIKRSEVSDLFRGDIGNWIVLNGEYLNKSNKDENNLIFNHKLVIFDILVYNSEYLIGQTIFLLFKIFNNTLSSFIRIIELLFDIIKKFIYRF